MDWYIKNLAWIHGRDEQLYHTLLDMVEPRPEVDWCTVDLMMRPKEWLFGLGPFSALATVLLYGFGDGEHILHLIQKLGKRGHLIIVIPDLPEFLEMLHIADMEEILSDRRVHIVVLGLNDDALLRYMAGCMIPETIGLTKIFILPGYEEVYPDGLGFMDQALDIVIQWMQG